MITLKDGSVWHPVIEEARELWNNGVFDLYDVDEAEGTAMLIETHEELLRSYENDTTCIKIAGPQKPQLKALGLDVVKILSLNPKSPLHRAKLEVEEATWPTYTDDVDQGRSEHLYSLDDVKDGADNTELIKRLIETADALDVTYIRFEE